MPARKKRTTGRATKTGKKRGAPAGAVATLRRLPQDVPRTLREFSRRLRTALSRLEDEITRARTAARGQATRLLRDASQALGRYEAYGDRQWRRLTVPARREVLRLLRRLEAALAAPRPKRVRRAKKPRPAPPPPPAAAKPAPDEEPEPPPLASGM